MACSRWRTWGVFIGLFALAFTVRFGRVLILKLYQHMQEGETVKAATSLARTGMLGNIYAPDSGPSAHVAPVWPFLMSLLYRVFGVDTPAAMLAQAILAITITSLCIACLPWLARQVRLAPAAGLLAAGALALSPLCLYSESSGTWEQPLAALVVLGLLAGFAALHDTQWQSKRLVVLLGVLVGFSALLSPTLLPAAALMMFAELCTLSGQRLRVLASSCVVVLLAGAVVAPWVYRNHRVLGGWVLVRSNLGLELYIGNESGGNGKTYAISSEDPTSFIFQVHPFFSRLECDRLEEIGELAYMREKGRLARAWIRDHPWQFAELTARRCRLFWFPPADLWPPSNRWRELRAWLFSGVSLGAFCCLGWMLATRQPHRWLLVAALVGPSLAYLVTHVDERYRYPVFPLSMLLACQLLVLAARQVARLRSS